MSERDTTAWTPAALGIRIGIAANWRQFSLLMLVNAFVGAMIGIERTVLPLLAADTFGIASIAATTSFIVAFGVTKALANLVAGKLADRVGRKRVLLAGWVAALPVAPMIIFAPAWGWVVAANVLLGVNQGLAWSATVLMMIDLAGARRRGLALGLNEAAGYGAVAATAWLSGLIAAVYSPRPLPFVLSISIAGAGLVISQLAVRDTSTHAAREAVQVAAAGPARPAATTLMDISVRDRTMSALCHAGLINNLNDGMSWGLVPIFLAAQGLLLDRIGVVTGVYLAVWGAGQLATGAWSDRVGRKPLIVAGLLLQAVAIAALVLVGTFGGWVLAAAGMGAGVALVYPTLLAAVADRTNQATRGTAVGVYRLWRDLGFAVGALLSGVLADLLGLPVAIATVAAVSAVAGLAIAVRMEETKPSTTGSPAGGRPTCQQDSDGSVSGR